MNRRHLIRLVLAVFLAGAARSALAQQSLEIIPLRHRTVDQVLPALQPLLEPGGTLSGNRGQLILRASPGNAADIKRALAAIDQPSRRLQISVRFDDARESERQRIGVQGSIGSGGVHVSGTAQQSAGTLNERVDQRLQVLDGSEAMIFSGPDFGSGLRVRPQVSGDRVLLDVAPQSGTQRIVTTVSARLGEWVELGGTGSARNRDERAIGVTGAARLNDARRVWLKVEELPN